MDTLINAILVRLREPSTWAGLGPLLTAIGWQVSPDLWQAISAGCMGVCGVIAIVLSEKTKKA